MVFINLNDFIVFFDVDICIYDFKFNILRRFIIIEGFFMLMVELIVVWKKNIYFFVFVYIWFLVKDLLVLFVYSNFFND